MHIQSETLQLVSEETAVIETILGLDAEICSFVLLLFKSASDTLCKGTCKSFRRTSFLDTIYCLENFLENNSGRITFLKND